MIHLDFINRAYDLERPDVVFFHKDLAEPAGELVAWKVIHRCGVDWHHPFRLPLELELGLVDADGNHTPRIMVRPGCRFTLVRRRDGPRWSIAAARDPQQIEVANADGEAVSCRLTRDGRAVVMPRWLAVGAMTSFRIDAGLWVGAVRGAREGDPLGPFEREVARTRLDLVGIRRGEVWMIGGGIGAAASPFCFHLVVKP